MVCPQKNLLELLELLNQNQLKKKNENSLLTYYLHVHRMYVMEANERTNVHRERK